MSRFEMRLKRSATLASLLLIGCGQQPAPQPLAAKPADPDGMIWISGGTFTMGDDGGFPDERPAHNVKVSGFYLDRHEVTNAQFAEFVNATGYVTVAERPLAKGDFPNLKPDERKPGSLVLDGTEWSFVQGACWKQPQGPGSDITDRMNHPVVQVAWEDAVAYCKWAGKRLPTEAEWEYAARAGAAKKYIWGDDEPAGQANIGVGDKFTLTAPVETYKPNGNGLYDMAGNVWEWCADAYDPKAYRTGKVDPKATDRVLRGGSFLCFPSTCQGYRPSARMKSSPDTGLMHVGFRCAKDSP